MNKGKWTLNRIFAFVLALMMILTVPEVSSAAVIGADTEDAVVESTETKDEEVFDIESVQVEADDKAATNTANSEIIYEEIVDLGEIQISAGGTTFFGADDYISKTSGNHADWIDRIEVSDAGKAFYNAMAEAVNNDGTADFLIDDDYYSANNTMGNIHVFNYSDGSSETCNVVKYTSISSATNSFDTDTIYAEMRAVYDAFDRDYPEVFWLSGSTTAATSLSYDYGTELYTATFYLILKNHTDAFDIRATAYQTEAAIKNDITVRDNAIKTILSGTSATDTVELIKYFNNWLTKNNAYCTADAVYVSDYPALSYECLSALKGSEGETGPVCEAYARAFKILCNEKKIPCVLVDGYAKSNSNTGEAHMWNYVQVGTNWYAVDVTWNDPYVESGVAVSGSENEGWLLLGSNTVVTNAGMTFIESHPVSNQASYNGVTFTNGPVLSEKAYEVSDIKSIVLTNGETVYGYEGDTTPTVTVTLESGADGVVTYKWYKAIWNANGEISAFNELTEETGNKLSEGLDSNVYGIEVYYDGELVGYKFVYVYMKELTPTIIGTTSKTYDGTTDYTGSDLTIKFDDVVNDDVISATADFAYTDANAGTNKTINATNIVLEGERVYNYKLTTTTATANVGTIEAKDISGATVALDKDKLTYNGTVQTVNPTVTVGGKTLVVGTDYTVSGNTAKDVRDSEYIVTVTGKGNYTGTAAATYTISYLDEAVTILYNEKEMVPAWVNENVIISAEGYTVSDSLDGTYSANYVVSKEGQTTGLKLYFKNAEGYITDATDINTINIDKTAPAFTGENDGIKVATNVWKEFLNTITFGIFHIDTQDVSISATDNGSGVLTYWYYVDKSGSTTVKTAEELEECSFTALEPNSKFSISEDGKYVIYAYAGDAAGNVSGYICTNGIVIDTTAPTITGVVAPTVDNGNLKDTSATISFTGSEAGEFYYVSGTVDLSGATAESIVQTEANNKTSMVAGTNTFTVSGLNPNTKYYVAIVAKDVAGNYSAVKVVEFTTQKTLPTIITDPTISGIYGETVGAMSLDGGVASVNGTEIEGTWSVTTDITDVPEVGTTKEYTVKFTPLDATKYGEATVKVVPTVAKKAVTVTINNASKTFGTDNPTFTYTENELVGSESTEVLGITISTTATKTSDVGTYAITGTANAKNYSVTFTNGTLTITKATATNPAAIEKEYVYGLGSEGTATVDITKGLPTDRGNTTYTVETNGSIVTEAKVENGILTYTVSTGNLNDTATITVIATSKNYEDITITVNIKLVDKLTVSPKGEITTVGTLTYGDTLSKLTFGEVTFVDSQDNAVAGTITWDAPTTKLDAGTHVVAWTFTPSNTGKYKTATGTVSVTVAKATPEVAAPTVDAITYNPSKTLAEVTLPTETNGTWSWKDTSVVPTVGNTGYVAVFTPTDTTNYNTVEKTVVVEVAKATPVVSVAPTAADIEYLKTLADSTLSGGKVVYAEGSSVEVDGTWSWKDATIAPTVADSDNTEYEVVFTPADTTNYNTTTVKVKLVVDKAQWPENVPADEIAADYDWNVISKVELPEGWVWAEEVADTELDLEEVVTAIANYVGDDKDNFVNITKEIKVTRNGDAPHIEGDESTMGWEAITEEMKDTTEDEVRVDMNGHCVVSGDALETLRDEDKTLVVIFVDEDGKEEYTWTIKGEDVKDGDIKALDMDAALFDKEATDKPAIPETLVKDVVTGAKDHKFLSLSHDGAFGFKASLTINVGTANAGKLVTLYYYNETTGKLEKTENVEIEVAADGSIVLAFEHASDYVLAINDKVVTPPQGGEDGSTPAPAPGPTAPNTGDSVFGNIYLYITLVLAGGLASYVGFRKKREEQI